MTKRKPRGGANGRPRGRRDSYSRYEPGEHSKKSPAPVENRDYWCDQRTADAKFQEALKAAGMLEGVVTEPGTENPQTVRRPTEGRIVSNAAGWTL